jgi:hypothetical protein
MFTRQQCEIGTDVGNALPVNLRRHDREPGSRDASTAYDPDLLLGERRSFIHLPRARTQGTADGQESRQDETRAARSL